MYKHAISLTCPNADTTVKDLATLQSSCPSVTPGVDGNYFSIASEDRLGVAQTHQFQSSGETGNIWGSYYSDVDGVKTKDTSSVKNNEYAEMPRSFNNTTAIGLYNYFAATTENLPSGYPPDSICPRGWDLAGGSETPLFPVASYNIVHGLDGVNNAKKLPVSFQSSGLYDDVHGTLNRWNDAGYYWLGSHGSKSNAYGIAYDANTFWRAAGNNTIRGLAIRCIHLDD